MHFQFPYYPLHAAYRDMAAKVISAHWVHPAVPATLSSPQAAATHIGPFTQTSGTCLA